MLYNHESINITTKNKDRHAYTLSAKNTTRIEEGKLENIHYDQSSNTFAYINIECREQNTPDQENRKTK